MNNFMAKRTDNSGWIIATATQVVPAIVIMIGLPSTPDSPRWLVGKDRFEDALKVLRPLRHKEDASNDLCEFELVALQEDDSKIYEEGGLGGAFRPEKQKTHSVNKHAARD
ncbi:uncharacterized protein A1O9_07905 [Exophiala aquamarina CBS 119918]|uniref:Major facilitator superfamily (MFS) profile domain-containing protein n=1 Tax=Exophiala aquamarina CBS 119918 TaxID=1182545 RepID=A0A072P8C0_9EURO|nr:uncharacterized protein A1O9_07905 [Exophiala aquamarina CBS 119918]KEF56324.1 hypothetical protein A1O9_07905 [Exophiala aquamarina CBS 119918]